MANISIWSNVQVSIQTVLGAAKTITAITKANPGVASSTAHGFLAGEYVLINALGMTELNGRIFRVINPAANTFEIEAEDTTLYTTFVSGTAQLITFGINMTTATGLSASGGDFEFIDTTTIHDSVRSQIPGLASASSYNFENLWDVADAALLELKEASDNRGQRAILFQFSNGQKVVFTGYVGATLLPGGSAQNLVTTPVVITMYGRPKTYAT